MSEVEYPDVRKFLTEKQAAAALGVHLDTLRGYRRRNEIEVIEIARRYYYKPSAIDEFVAAKTRRVTKPRVILPARARSKNGLVSVPKLVK